VNSPKIAQATNPESDGEPETEPAALVAVVESIDQPDALAELEKIEEIEELLAMPELDPTTLQSLEELDSLIGELKAKVSTLREGEYDASALEARLRELTELASRAASTLESVSR